jgi:polysaccharide export outer membrane protein
MKKNLYLNIFIFQAILILTSCVNQKQIAYFQKGVNQSDTIAVAMAYVPKIQPGDILAINVGSLNPIASSFFNPFSTMPVTTDNTSGGINGVASPGAGSVSNAIAPSVAPGFLVDSAGTIELPLIGALEVSGLSTSELREIIKKHLITYLKEPTVNVRFLNYKISVMGEVARPSVYVIPNERITLPEALSMAGDLTILGRRTNILIVRDNNGKKEFGHVDLTSREVYNSPYYYLRSNDIVYVEPSKVRIQQSDPFYKILPIVISAISVIALSIYYGRHS